MKIKSFGNTERREELMNILWNSDTPLSAQDILEASPKKMANITYVHRALNELLDGGLIRESGTKRYNTQYARLFSCTYTREEYAAQYMRKIGIPAGAMGKVALALINDKSDKKTKQELVDELEAIIEDLKGKKEKVKVKKDK